MTKLAVVSTDYDGTHVVIASGEIDMSTAPELSTALTHAITTAAPLIVDLAGIEFIDSSGLHALAKANLEARAKACRLVIVPSPAMNRVIELAGATGAFELAPTVADALRLARTTT